VVWDDPEAWLMLEHGAIRWVGEVSNEQAVAWLKAHEHAALAGMPREESIPRRVLRVLARSRLIHKSSNDSHI
ncbi:MAG: hypothetical protein JO031_15400, partial [Ktedonobacteraceae bacterium]|nr:hypothetical protein [Ktedonobacteraceae bacterium]